MNTWLRRLGLDVELYHITLELDMPDSPGVVPVAVAEVVRTTETLRLSLFGVCRILTNRTSKGQCAQTNTVEHFSP